MLHRGFPKVCQNMDAVVAHNSWVCPLCLEWYCRVCHLFPGTLTTLSTHAARTTVAYLKRHAHLWQLVMPDHSTHTS